MNYVHILRCLVILILLLPVTGACQPQVTQPQVDKTAVAATVEKYLEVTSTPTVTATPEPPLLPAPMYFLSDRSGTTQIWRIEMNGGLAHPVTQSQVEVTEYDISPRDGSLAYVTGNDLYIARPDGSQAQKIIAGEAINEGSNDAATKQIHSVLWSPDGTRLAFSRNGINIYDLNTGETRSVVTNNIPNMNNNESPLGWRTYHPSLWSPDGNRMAVMIGLYEGTGVAILSIPDGVLSDLNLPACCDLIQAVDPQSFYLASAMLAFGEAGFWQIRWDTGQITNLTSLIPASGEYPVYANPKLSADGRLYFLYGTGQSPSLVTADPANLGNLSVLAQFEFFPGSALWSPDAHLFVMSGQKYPDPMLLWQTGRPLVPLEMNGYLMKWGIKTEADVLTAGTPVPTFTPTPTLPAVPAISQVISPENVSQLQLFTQVDGREEVYGLAVSPDGKLLALGLETSVHLWDIQTMQMLAKFGPYGNIIPGLDFSPDSRFLAVGSWDKQVDMYDVTTLQKVRSFSGHTGSLHTVRFSPNGRQLATTEDDNALIISDVASGTAVRMVNLGAWGTDLSYSPDGRLLAVSTWEKDTVIYDTTSGNVAAQIQRPADQWVLNLAFSKDGRTLALGTWGHQVLLWDVSSNSIRKELTGFSDFATGLAFSPDNRLIATADQKGELRLWDAVQGIQLNQITGERKVTFTTDGRFLISPGKSLSGANIWFVP